jgi:hypothetical protein
MAGGQYTAPRGGARCSFSDAIQFLALRDFAKAAQDVFALDTWPAELVDLFFDLCSMLERGLVHAYRYGKEIPASDWIRHRSALEQVLRDKEVLGIGHFISSAAQLTKHCFVDVEELMAASAPNSLETPRAALYEGEGATRSSKPSQDEDVGAEKLLTMASHKDLVDWCKEAKANGARNRTEVDAYVKERAFREKKGLVLKDLPAARRDAKSLGNSRPTTKNCRRLKPGNRESAIGAIRDDSQFYLPIFL